MNSILQKFQDIKILGSAAIGVLTFGMVIGYFLAPSPKPKEFVCAKEISQVKVLGAQIENLRQKHLQEFKDFQQECILKQNEICSQKVLRYRAACLELKCEICKASK